MLKVLDADPGGDFLDRQVGAGQVEFSVVHPRHYLDICLTVRTLLVMAAVTLSSLGMAGEAVMPLNVMDFGAKGDGKTDDTQAIQKAFDAMRKNRSKAHMDEPFRRGVPASPTVYFPTGHYLISDTININGASRINGETAIINQRDPQKDIFVGKRIFHPTISGFKFVNGRNHIQLNNRNRGGLFRVHDCEFHGALGVAVEFWYESQSTLAVLERCDFIKKE